MNKPAKKGLIFIVAILAMVGLVYYFNTFYIQWIWFHQMGYLDIFLKELTTKIKLFAMTFGITFILIALYGVLLKKTAPKLIVEDTEKKNKWHRWLIPAVGAFFSAELVSRTLWLKWLRFSNYTDFGKTDPLFNQDIGFYFFKLAFYQELYGLVMGLFVVGALMSILYLAYRHYRYVTSVYDGATDFKSGFGIGEMSKRFFTAMSKPLSFFVGTFFLLLTAGLILRRFQFVYGGTGMVYGAGATDVNIGLNLLTVVTVIAFISSILTYASAFLKRKFLLILAPLVMVALLFSSSVLQTAYQYAFVNPDQFSKEQKFLEKNIQATRESYGLDQVEIKEFSTTQNITAEDILENSETIENIPINDRNPTKDMYNSIQGIRNYYSFGDVDVDRYRINDTYTQVFLGTREINSDALPDDAKTWVNKHLKYTHGFGLAMSPVNKTNEVGQPQLLVKDIPPQTEHGALAIEEPRIYFGEEDYEYVIVNARSPEFDYPSGEDNQEVFYKGEGGIQLNLINRLAFAFYYRSPELLLSPQVTFDSKILINRNVMSRVQTIAPFLQYDEDPYMTIADGRLYWIIDAFVVDNRYPYATPFDQATKNNYIQNSVKVIVDAYNGDVTFYKVHDEPLIETYSKIYPKFVKDISEMPEELRAHIRYSKKLFDIQTDIYKTYHMKNPQVFYNLEDQWETAKQLYGPEKEKIPLESSYIIMKLPDRETEFMLMTVFTPRNKDNMIAWMAGVSDGDEYGKMVLYQFPKQQLVYGPMQIEQRVDQNPVIAPQLTLLGQQGSRVLRGNMMAIPIEDAILYVEPIYIQSSTDGNHLPEVKKVVVGYRDQVVMADSLKEALGEIFTDLIDDETDAPEDSVPKPLPKPTNGADRKLVDDANKAFEEAKKAQQAGDWSTFGEKLNELEQLLKQLQEKN
jgi:uncharacterized membrane protein (UPF0182 family)